MTVYTHKSVIEESERFFQMYKRRIYITPKSYLDLLSLFQKMLKEFKGNVESNIRKLSFGLTKLAESNTKVAALEENLKLMQPILQQKTID